MRDQHLDSWGYPMVSGSQEAAAFRSVKRVCYAGLDSVSLRTEVARRLALVVPFSAYAFTTMDPDTGLLTHAVGEKVPEGVVREYVEVLYPQQEAMRVLDRVRSGATVVTSTSELFTELICSHGVGHELNTIFFSGETLWGDLCLLRESRTRAYAEHEMRFMRRIAPHIARGLKAASTLGPAQARDAAGPASAEDAGNCATGVVVLDAKGRIVLRNRAATMQLEDLADVGVPTGETPYALRSTLALLSARQRQAGTDTAAFEDAAIRARGRIGSWYTLRASLSEPDAEGDSSTIVSIEPVARRELAPILTRLYGLSPREREIVALAARGESTKAMAARLHLSTYTVQDHLGNACEKVGVRGRKALLAKLFFDGYAATMWD
jgi:DNA-binding CsgD family transcriptional regulator